MTFGFSNPQKKTQYKKIRIGLENPYGFHKTHLADIYNTTNEHIYACRKHDDMNTKIKLTLPRNFSWGDPYNNSEFDDDVEDQKECGFCYIIASVYTLKKRFEILLWNRYKKKIKMPKLSNESIIKCSPYNQGCEGGYPFLVGKHIYEYGIVPEDTLLYANDNGNMCKLSLGIIENMDSYNSNSSSSSSSSNNVNEVYYASDYNYINGCYECSNEYDMMYEILQNGPIIAAINADKTLIDMYNITDEDFIYDVDSNAHKICDIPNEGFNGWQETNHAITIVGWGEQLDKNNKIKKYWIIRNTWGKQWGYNGYIKFQRGFNVAGIELQTVYIDPDFTRGYA
uniref:Peptidase C1A papain C-terminal domain-containing protein n=1 Tax=Piliocolobus tephrosceles TaxID=591936 RepID=A0A8C9GMF1_9PRIM